MKEETQKCNSCGQLMFEVGETGKILQIGEIGKDGLWKQTGMRNEALYQCPKCKDVKIY